MAFNCTAAICGLAPALAMGGTIDGDAVVFPRAPQKETLTVGLENWIRATSQETAIIARCTGKTNIHNLEPEDMRCISIATAEATGIPLASGQVKREGF